MRVEIERDSSRSVREHNIHETIFAKHSVKIQEKAARMPGEIDARGFEKIRLYGAR